MWIQDRDERLMERIRAEGIGGFVEEALEWARIVGSTPDEHEVAQFCSLLCGSYASNAAGIQRRADLARTYLPTGLVHAHLFQDGMKRPVGVYDDGRQPVRASSLAMAIAMSDPVRKGRAVVRVRPRSNATPGVLELDLLFS